VPLTLSEVATSVAAEPWQAIANACYGGLVWAGAIAWLAVAAGRGRLEWAVAFVGIFSTLHIVIVAAGALGVLVHLPARMSVPLLAAAAAHAFALWSVLTAYLHAGHNRTRHHPA
jgi:hypothetical protein